MSLELILFDRDLEEYKTIIKRRVNEALFDDAFEDLTTEALVFQGNVTAEIIAEEDGILCGVLEAKEVFRGLNVEALVKEGEKIRKGKVIMKVEGKVSEILRRERMALNYLQILSGIATETKKLVLKVGKGKVAALRKNHPLLTESEKRAVQIAGGLTHRMGLGDGYLIKNTHLEYLRKGGNLSRAEAVKVGVAEAVEHRRRKGKKVFVEVEVMSMEEAIAAAESKAEAVLIDNQTPRKVKEFAKEIRKRNLTILIEASGGITPQNAKEYLKAGANFVSASYFVLRSKPIGMHLRLVI